MNISYETANFAADKLIKVINAEVAVAAKLSCC